MDQNQIPRVASSRISYQQLGIFMAVTALGSDICLLIWICSQVFPYPSQTLRRFLSKELERVRNQHITLHKVILGLYFVKCVSLA